LLPGRFPDHGDPWLERVVKDGRSMSGVSRRDPNIPGEHRSGIEWAWSRHFGSNQPQLTNVRIIGAGKSRRLPMPIVIRALSNPTELTIMTRRL